MPRDRPSADQKGKLAPSVLAPFDPNSGALTGTPVAVFPQVQYLTKIGRAVFSVSGTGPLFAVTSRETPAPTACWLSGRAVPGQSQGGGRDIGTDFVRRRSERTAILDQHAGQEDRDAVAFRRSQLGGGSEEVAALAVDEFEHAPHVRSRARFGSDFLARRTMGGVLFRTTAAGYLPQGKQRGRSRRTIGRHRSGDLSARLVARWTIPRVRLRT